MKGRCDDSVRVTVPATWTIFKGLKKNPVNCTFVGFPSFIEKTGPAEAKLNRSGRVRDCVRKHAAGRGGGGASFGGNFSNLMF